MVEDEGVKRRRDAKEAVMKVREVLDRLGGKKGGDV